MCKWTYEVIENNDIWRGDIFNTKDEAVKEGTLEAIEYEKDTFRIGMCEKPDNFGVDADMVIEDIRIMMYSELGEVAEDYLDDVTTEHKLELEEKLNAVFYTWQEEHNYKPTFYKVVSEEVVKVFKMA